MPFRVRYQTIEFDSVDIHLCTLRDKQQFSDQLGEAESMGISSAQWSLFGVVWESSEILAREMQDFDIKNKRILELGCGIGLASLLLNSRFADITATDIHPLAGQFLADNVRLNQGRKIPFLRASWLDDSEGLGLFDVIIGSDVLYERQHIELLAQFILLHAQPRCEVILVDPGRGMHAPFSKKMISLGFSHSQRKPEYADHYEGDSKGQILSYGRLQ